MHPVPIDFHFDVMCPWAYQTSLWIREVRDQGLVDVTWRFFSLEEVNREDGKKHPWERDWSYGWGMLRVAAELRRQDGGITGGGNDLVDRYYAVAGSWLHEQARKPHSPDAARAVLAEIGADPALVDAALADPTTTDEVRVDHDAVLAKGAFGVPTLVFPSGQAVYGPVVVPAPTGADAAASVGPGAGLGPVPPPVRDQAAQVPAGPGPHRGGVHPVPPGPGLAVRGEPGALIGRSPKRSRTAVRPRVHPMRTTRPTFPDAPPHRCG